MQPGDRIAPPQARCELCLRNTELVTKHHLIPRSQHDKRYARRRFTREEMVSRVAWLCPPCHKFIHTVFTERELGAAWNQLEALRQHPEIADFIRWLAAKPSDFMPRVRTMKRPRKE
ncbi:MAG: hypothetical protein MUF20_06465 [Methylotetracoccus sp.]|nr:hypothetical protein [Methylotetracoccus sp.]